jgi:hypothetical protein
MSNLSAGVQILIDQLASNPDEFFGPIGRDPEKLYVRRPPIKFHDFERALRVLTLGQPGADGDFWFLTDEEKAALRVAYKEACRIRFDANIIATLHAKPEEDYDAQGQVYTGNLVSSMTTTKSAISNSVLSSAFSNGIANVSLTGSSS